jgi:PAS domain-containing protein
MTYVFDFRVMVVVYAFKYFCEAIALAYVWYSHRRYEPARYWAIGMALNAIGSLLILIAWDSSPSWLVVARSLVVFMGFLVFSSGILQASSRRLPWRSFLALTCVTLTAQWWFTDVARSGAARVAIFNIFLTICTSYVAFCVLRVPRGPLRATQLVIATMLLLQSAATLCRALSMTNIEFLFPLRSDLAIFGIALISIGSSFMLTLALAIFTSQRTTALLEATLDNLTQGVAMFDADQKLIICNRRYGEIYGLDTDHMQPGTPLQTIVTDRIARGIFAGSSAHEYFRERTAPVIEATTALQQLTTGAPS